MSNTLRNRNRLITLLKELFQLDKPELDFGLYKIMHAKSVQITRFLENDLLKEIEQAFGEKDSVDAGQLKAQAIAKLKEALGEDAIDENGNLQAAFEKIPAGKKYLEEIAAAEVAKDTVTAESDVYDHLYRFFERYYDNGDFMSRRYYARESDSRAAPYAVPYDGREVYLHWANKDQYYIKSSEYLNNYTFELNEAIRQEVERQKGLKGKGPSLGLKDVVSEQALKVHFRIVDASEGEHGNIKAASDQKRFFIVHEQAPCLIENGELVIQFQYRIDNEKTGQDNKWQETRLQQAEAAILEALQADKEAAAFVKGLSLPAPTDAKDKRSLLGKHLQKYANKNSMDYFIHKDLGGFMRRELDFYIKNEIMRLDDLESADAPKVESYLTKVKVLRRIAQQLIAFLAQLEDFQKKLWLKKKFVTETNYCITLDRIPEKFYPEIAANEKQHAEWVKLFAIDEITGSEAKDMFGKALPAYSKPLSLEFLKSNSLLLVDTALYADPFREKLLSHIPDVDAQCDGVLIHSENFQVLQLMQGKYCESIKTIYIDPPYNTSASEIAYKNSYKHSSWISLIANSLQLTKPLFNQKSGVICCTIDDAEQKLLSQVIEESFGEISGTVAIRIKPSGRPIPNGFAISHEYAIFSKVDSSFSIARLEHSDEQIARYREKDKNGRFFWEMFRKAGSNSNKKDRPTMFYAFYLNIKTNTLRLPKMEYDETNEEFAIIEKLLPDEKIIYPIKDDGSNGRWYFGLDRALGIQDEFKAIPQPNGEHWIYYRRRPNEGVQPTTLWFDSKYSATEHGTALLKAIFGEQDLFSYPKSIHAVEDCLSVTGASDYKDCTILDYFAGSGTTGHATINFNRDDNGKRKYILVEQNNYFDTVLKPRMQKIIYSKDWKDGKPVLREGISHCFKYLRLESYEDALNNLVVREDADREAALEKNPDLQRDYLLNYFLDVETKDSQSLLNIADFRDPTAYKMYIKKPSSEEQSLQNIDLIETFNWLLGLWVDHMAAPQSFNAEFERDKDADLPADQNTRLLCKKLKPDAKGDYWFRLIEGYTLKVPGDNNSKQKTLVIWRKQTDDAEKDNAVLQKYLLEKLQISPRENTYAIIYINGSHTLPNPVIEGEQTKVRLIEEAFHNAMWTGENV